MAKNDRHAIVQLIANAPGEPCVGCACGWIHVLPDPWTYGPQGRADALLDAYLLHLKGYNFVSSSGPSRQDPDAEPPAEGYAD